MSASVEDEQRIVRRRRTTAAPRWNSWALTRWWAAEKDEMRRRSEQGGWRRYQRVDSFHPCNPVGSSFRRAVQGNDPWEKCESGTRVGDSASVVR